ncbi:MAG: N,N-dimethylformamidase [Hyphomicrobiaceae bacterium]|nr:N,N-dimethylformamidase [Hyphomicrobiaceae bacterium]
MLPIAGYADRLSVRPGETIAFKVSNATGAPVTTRLVRVISADPNPAGLGLREEAVASSVRMVKEPGHHGVQRGSFAHIDGGVVVMGLSSLTLIATVQPTQLGRECAILCLRDGEGRRGVGLGMDERGRFVATFGLVEAIERLECPEPVRDHAWYRVWLTYDARSRQATIGQQALKTGRPDGPARTAASQVALPQPIGAGQILVSAAGDENGGLTFNGRIERPMIFDRVLSADDVASAAEGKSVSGLVAGWDFSREISSTRIVDIGPHGLHGRLVDMPTRAVTGSTWTGREMCWRHAPAEYAAIHFHDDDIEDCRWPTSYEWTVPEGLRSGTYALRLEAGGEQENIPFFVVVPKGRKTADICVLVSTFTYVVYGNHARPEWLTDPAWRTAWEEQTKAWGGYPHNPGQHREYGLSTYNFHTDGSGICFASWHRPMLNVRSGYITYPDPEIRGSGLRHYPADSHLIAWLEAKGLSYDLITDWELHHEGYELLKPYRVVMTGSHPEYHTREMLDALETYRDNGGRFCYLGGNGFYWKIALSKEKPGLIEIRRAEGGIRAWAAEAGEYYNQLDGEYGGLWRRNGRPPQELCGVGFTAQGNFVGSYYRVLPEASDPRVSWVLEGVTDERIGDFGLSGHGAAGFELDRTDKRLGTPRHAIVIARSEDHPPEAPWVLVPEEQLTHLTTIPGEPPRELIHADMTFFETPNNGAVFSTGSITFCGCLPVNGFENNISRLLQNVVDRFLDPEVRFEVPAR